jgi:hypothetical protein
MEGDFFSIALQDNILVVTLRNTAEVPTINFHSLGTVFSAMQAVIAQRELAKTGWAVLYDFSAVINYEMTAATAFANFFRWARRNGRLKAAHIFPRSRSDGEVSMIKRVILSLVTQLAQGGDDHYTAADLADGLDWMKRVMTAQPDESA